MDISSRSGETRAGPFQIVILILSLLVFAALLADTFSNLPSEVSQILQGFDLLVCGVFFLDFCARFANAHSKLEFMKWGWIDLVACIPNIDFFRFGRLVRVLRLIRLFRGIRSFHRLLQIFFRNKNQGAAASVLLITFLLIAFSSLAILMCEREPDSNIKSAEDAIWWSVTTITTVGYGDRYPVTTEGRIIAMILMLSGVGLFGTLSGLVASFFLGAKQAEEEANIKGIRIRLDALVTKLEEQKPKNGME